MVPSTPLSKKSALHNDNCSWDHRVIAHFDVDAFYVACERELKPELRDRAVAVSQYNPYGDLSDRFIEDDKRLIYDEKSVKNHPDSNGSLIAVSYEARAQKVKRNDRGKDAIKKCPELIIMQVPVKNGKADLTIYRSASQRLMTELVNAIHLSTIEIYKNNLNESDISKTRINDLKPQKIEKASIDEIYIDLSEPVNRIFHDFQKVKSRDFDIKNNCGEKHKYELFFKIFWTGGAEKKTTVGGLETSEAALATNSLSKDDIRKGSFLQTIDSHSNHIDSGSLSWWMRPISEWNDEEVCLAIGASITHLARSKILSKFNSVFTLSAGVSLNKLLAKLASGLKKPNRQTIINPNDKITLKRLFHPLPIGRIRGLGGKFGNKISSALQISTVGELSKISLNELINKFPEQAHFLFEVAQGKCRENVSERTRQKSVAASKTFRGALSFSAKDEKSLHKWLKNLIQEVMDRLQDDQDRYAKTLVVSLTFFGENSVSQSAHTSRYASFVSNLNIVFNLAQKIISIPRQNYSLIGLSVSATNFVEVIIGLNSIENAISRISTPNNKKIVNNEQKQKPKISEINECFVKDSKGGTNAEQNTASFSISKRNKGFQKEMPLNSCKSKEKTCHKYDEQYTELRMGSPNQELDNEYAKNLQASFDRENEVLSSIEKRFASSSKNRKNCSKRKLFCQSQNQNINMFFSKKKKDMK